MSLKDAFYLSVCNNTILNRKRTAVSEYLTPWDENTLACFHKHSLHHNNCLELETLHRYTEVKFFLGHFNSKSNHLRKNDINNAAGNVAAEYDS